MKFFLTDSIAHQSAAGMLIVPVIQERETIIWPIDFEKSAYERPLILKDFKGKETETILQYTTNDQLPRILLLGLGPLEDITQEVLRRCFSLAMKKAWSYKASKITLTLPNFALLPHTDIYEGILEGLLLANYTFDQLKSEESKKNSFRGVEEIRFISNDTGLLACAERAWIIAQGVYLARDLVNGNADDVTPAFLARLALDLPKTHAHIQTTVWDQARIEKEGMGLLLAVSRASRQSPVFIVSHYQGNPRSKEQIVLVGKGITYDTGGLNLKPTGSMETMKCDMSGAAVVIASLIVASQLKVKKNITVIVPSTENAIDAHSFKPGDVYTSYAGKTVEIANTDAEGRLILADALAYAVKHLQPTTIIDVATLTLAIDFALGSEAIGLFSNNDTLAQSLIKAGNATFERVWRMPLFNEYKEQLRSEIADLRNRGSRSAGSSVAALFLQEFVGSVPWAHLDIASVAYLNEAKRYHPRFATGIGVRLLVEFLSQ